MSANQAPKESRITEAIQNAKEQGLRVLKRIGFHLTSISVGLLAGLVAPHVLVQTGSSLFTVLGTTSIAAITYLSLLQLFPMRPNPAASAMGIVTAIAGIFTGYWPLGLAFGGIVSFVLNTIARRRLGLGSLVALILLVVAMGTGGAGIFAVMPMWYNALLAGVTAFGVIRPHFGERLYLRVSDWLQRRREQKATTKLEHASTPEGGIDTQPYQQLIDEIDRLKFELTPKMVYSVTLIVDKAQDILKTMKEDPRDVVSASVFLNRYLPMIRTTVERFNRLKSVGTTPSELLQISNQTEKSLSDMSHVFNEMYQGLLRNDVDDLMIDLKVMDKLARSEGYSIPRK